MKAKSRGSIIRRGQRHDRWTVVVPLGKDPANGKYRQQWIAVSGTRDDAERKLAERLAELDRGVPAQDGRLTVEQWLETWLRDIVAVRNAPRTLESYSYLVRHHLIPGIGHLQLSKLQPGEIDRLLAGMVAKGLSANTAHHAYTVLNKALTDAMRKGKVYRNVCAMVDPPKPGRYEPAIPDAEGVARVLALAKSDAPELWPLFRFCAFTGVRRAEACGLRWEHVDFEHSVASIVETVQRLLKRGLVVLPPKSASARRGVALDAGTADMLREHQGQQLLAKAELEGLYQDRGIVFATTAGGYLDPNVATRVWKRVARAAGFPDLNLHGLRHAHAAGLIRAGVHPKIVQDRLGHGSAAFTLQVYGHGSAALQAEAAEAFAEDMRKVH